MIGWPGTDKVLGCLSRLHISYTGRQRVDFVFAFLELLKNIKNFYRKGFFSKDIRRYFFRFFHTFLHLRALAFKNNKVIFTLGYSD